VERVALYHTEARRRLETVRRDFVRETSSALFAEAKARMTPWLRAIPRLRTEIEDDSVRSSASTIFDAQATYVITQWARLTLDVFNLLNAQVDDIAYFYKSRPSARARGKSGRPFPSRREPQRARHYSVKLLEVRGLNRSHPGKVQSSHGHGRTGWPPAAAWIGCVRCRTGV
jgi:hypothetical protein